MAAAAGAGVQEVDSALAAEAALARRGGEPEPQLQPQQPHAQVQELAQVQGQEEQNGETEAAGREQAVAEGQASPLGRRGPGHEPPTAELPRGQAGLDRQRKVEAFRARQPNPNTMLEWLLAAKRVHNTPGGSFEGLQRWMLAWVQEHNPTAEEREGLLLWGEAVLLDPRYWGEGHGAGSGLCCKEGDAQGSACGNWGVFIGDLGMHACKWKGDGKYEVRLTPTATLITRLRPNPNPSPNRNPNPIPMMS